MPAARPQHNNQTARWAFNIAKWKPTFEELAQISGIIQREEKDRISRFYFIKDAKASLVGRLMMRKLISQRLELQNTDIVLSRDPNNKPILTSPTGFIAASSENEDLSSESPLNSTSSEEDASKTSKKILCSDSSEAERRESLLKGLNFNVSHQGSYAVLASDSSAGRIGIDIMNITSPGKIADRLDDYFRMMKRQFTDFEWVQIKSYYGNTDSEQLKKFTRFWSLKESYVKAIGVGIIIDLKRIEFHTHEDLPQSGELITSTKVKVDGEWRFEWDFEERFIDTEHIVAVAKEFQERINIGDGEDLAAVEKEISSAAGQGDEGKGLENEKKTDEDAINSNEETGTGTAYLDIPSFQMLELDFLCRDMKLIEKPDPTWVDGFLTKKEKNVSRTLLNQL